MFFFYFWLFLFGINIFSLLEKFIILRMKFSLNRNILFFTMEIYHDQQYTFVIQYYSISQWMTLGPHSYIWLKSYNILLLDISSFVVNVTKSQFNLQSAGIANYFYFYFHFYFTFFSGLFLIILSYNIQNKK